MKLHAAIFGMFGVALSVWFVTGPFTQIFTGVSRDAETAAVVQTSVTVRIPSVQGAQVSANQVPRAIVSPAQRAIDACSGQERGAACIYSVHGGRVFGLCDGPLEYEVLACEAVR